MFKFEPAARLIPQVSAEDEWKYLVNETYIGEKCIVPLLKEIVAMDVGSHVLRCSLEVQLEEEIEHVRLFHRLVGPERLSGSGYDTVLKDYVSGLPKIALRLFALQGMLEGIALGALDYRLTIWGEAPSRATDRRAKIEELEHVSTSFKAFHDVILAEGSCTHGDFREVSQAVNSVFANSFSGATLATYANMQTTGIEADPGTLDSSAAIRWFRRQSLHTLAKNKERFMQTYFQAVANATA